MLHTPTEFNEDNSHFNFLRKKLEKACVVLEDADLARPASYGDNPAAPVPIQTSDQKFMADSCGIGSITDPPKREIQRGTLERVENR